MLIVKGENIRTFVCKDCGEQIIVHKDNAPTREYCIDCLEK